jgi:choline-sulfatase
VTNVLILMSDEHNAKVSSVYGHPRVETPNMERLAREGTTCDAAYCPSPLCTPSRSSFMSGLPVHQTQAYNNCNVVSFDYPSYGAVLADQGVHTVSVGKTDTYTSWRELGFSETFLPGDRKAPGDINFRRDPLAVRADGARRAAQFGPRHDAFDRDLERMDVALDWLANTAPTLDRPWTLTVNLIAPHFPHHATPELWDRYADAADLPSHGLEQESARHPYAVDLRRHFQADAFTEAQVRGQRQGYLARVDFVDRQLGRLLDALEATGQRDDTVVIYTSDHGEMLGKFGLWWKSSMYDDAVRVPLIAAGPGFAAGVRSSTAVSLLDAQAAMFRATGAARPAGWWGEPLQDAALDDPDRAVLSEYHGHGTRSGTFLIRKGRWKLLHHGAAPHQLFDLERDPEELDNRYDAEPEVAADLDAELRRRCDPDVELARAHEFERRQLALLAALSA